MSEPLCDEEMTKTVAEWGRHLINHEQTVRQQVADDLNARGCPAIYIRIVLEGPDDDG